MSHRGSVSNLKPLISRKNLAGNSSFVYLLYFLVAYIAQPSLISEHFHFLKDSQFFSVFIEERL